MKRRSEPKTVRLSAHEEPIAPVTILDGQGRMMRIAPAPEFRRTRAPTPPTLVRWRRRKGSS